MSDDLVTCPVCKGPAIKVEVSPERVVRVRDEYGAQLVTIEPGTSAYRSTSADRIAALEAERDVLKAERDAANTALRMITQWPSSPCAEIARQALGADNER